MAEINRNAEEKEEVVGFVIDCFSFFFKSLITIVCVLCFVLSVFLNKQNLHKMNLMLIQHKKKMKRGMLISNNLHFFVCFGASKLRNLTFPSEVMPNLKNLKQITIQLVSNWKLNNLNCEKVYWNLRNQ